MPSTVWGHFDNINMVGIKQRMYSLSKLALELIIYDQCRMIM